MWRVHYVGQYWCHCCYSPTVVNILSDVDRPVVRSSWVNVENCYLSVGVNRLLQVLTDQLLVNCVLCDVGGNEFELKCVISARPRWVTTELESPELTSGKARESCWPSEKNNVIVCVCAALCHASWKCLHTQYMHKCQLKTSLTCRRKYLDVVWKTGENRGTVKPIVLHALYFVNFKRPWQPRKNNGFADIRNHLLLCF